MRQTTLLTIFDTYLFVPPISKLVSIALLILKAGQNVALFLEE